MSQQVFPTLPGLDWTVVRSPVWSTIKHKSVSGRRLAASYFSYPLYKYSMGYEFLRAANGFAELQTLVGFFNQMRGSFDTFLYSDPVDNSVTAQAFGTGDGATVAFQLVRAFGGYVEPIYDFNGAPAIYKNDWQGNQLQHNTPRTNLLTYSEQFDNAAWGKNGCFTVTPDSVVAPDGNTTADTLVRNAASTGSFADLTLAEPVVAGSNVGKTFTASVWLWCPSGTVACHLRISDANYFTDVSPLITVTTTPTRYQFTSAGPWNVLGTSICIGLDVAASSTIYAWGAQLEPSAAATPYIHTQSAGITVTDYTINLSGGLRTNLLTYSEQFDNVAWQPTGVTVTPNSHTDPLGGTTADTLAFAATVNANIWQVATITANKNGSYTFSCWFDATASNTLDVQLLSEPSGAQYSAEQGIAITAGSMTRYSLTFNVTGITTDTQLRCYLVTRDSVARTIYAWGAQLEESPAATGYLPTTTQQVSTIDPGAVIFNTPPAAAAALTWTGNYYRRCAFQKDEADFENFMKDLWLNKKVELESIKP